MGVGGVSKSPQDDNHTGVISHQAELGQKYCRTLSKWCGPWDSSFIAVYIYPLRLAVTSRRRCSSLLEISPGIGRWRGGGGGGEVERGGHQWGLWVEGLRTPTDYSAQERRARVINPIISPEIALLLQIGNISSGLEGPIFRRRIRIEDISI